MVLSTEKCIFQNGVPEWGVEAIWDATVVMWEARSLSDGKHLTFVKNSVWEPLAEVLIKPTNVLEGLNVTVDQLGSSKEDDKKWNDVENKYKQLLDDCRVQCIKDEFCTKVYGTMKVVRPRQTAGADPVFDDDVEEYIKGIKKAELIFKCYSYGDKTQEYSMNNEYMEKCNGTRQFDVGNKEPDLDAVATHIWGKEWYFGDGNEDDCTTCVYHAGIPKSAFKTINKEWSPGSFALNDLTFMKQQSTVHAEILMKPVNLFTEASTDAKSAEELRYQGSGQRDWIQMETAYQKLLSNCSKKCNDTESCYYAYAAVKFLTKGDLRMPYLEDDIKDHLKDNDSSFVFKCYGLGPEKANSLAAVDTEHTKDKTPQFKTTFSLSGEEEDLRVMFSHVYKNPFPIVPKSTTTIAATTPAATTPAATTPAATTPAATTEPSDGCQCTSPVKAARDLKDASEILQILAKQYK